MKLQNQEPAATRVRSVLSEFRLRASGLLGLREFGVLLGAGLLSCVFALLSPLFLTMPNIATILMAASEGGVVTTGVTFLMISGEFDLSVSGPFTLTPLIAAILIRDYGCDWLIAISVGMAVAVLMGILNGAVVTRTTIPSFIVTLGSGMLFQGFGLLMLRSPVAITGTSIVAKALSGYVGPLRAGVLWFVGITILFLIILEKTKYGNWVLATGGNLRAALMAGVPVRKVKMINFIISATLAGFSGILLLARIQSVNPIQGQALPLQAIASSVIGGTSLLGGVGSILGGAIGALIVSMINAGLSLLGVSAYWSFVTVGLTIIVVVAINEFTSRGAARHGFTGS